MFENLYGHKDRWAAVNSGQIGELIYDEVPEEVRIDFLNICSRAHFEQYFNSQINYYEIVESIELYDSKRYFHKGFDVNRFGQRVDINYFAVFQKYVNECNVNEFLHCIQYVWRHAVGFREQDMHSSPVTVDFNQRMLFHGFGYQISGNQIIKVDNTLEYKEAIKPALHIISHPDLSAVDTDLRSALDRYYKADYKGSVKDAGNALEGALKHALLQHGKESALELKALNLSKLLGKFQRANLISGMSRKGIEGLSALLADTVGTTRNGVSHAAAPGDKPPEVEPHVANYTIVSVSSFIVLVEKLLK